MTYISGGGNGWAYFHDWLSELVGLRAQILVDKSVGMVRLGNLGDHKAVGRRVREVRLNHGTG